MRRSGLPVVALASALVLGALPAPASAASATTRTTTADQATATAAQTTATTTAQATATTAAQTTATATAKQPANTTAKPDTAAEGQARKADGNEPPLTLITGDRVMTHGQAVQVRPAPGREHVQFLSETIRDHRFIIPSDAIPLLRDARLDLRLFDLTELRKAGTDDLPLLIAYGHGPETGARGALAQAGARVTRDLPALGTLAARAGSTGNRAALWARLTDARQKQSVRKIWLNAVRTVADDQSDQQIGAPTAWQAGYDGTGVTVAVLDTGVDATHPDLAGQIAGAENFTTDPSTDDTVGHGTHVASIIAGTGAESGGRYRGVAPGAHLLIGKVCQDYGCPDDAILAGMAWAAARAPVINMSLGGPDQAGDDPLEEAVNELTARYDTLFVIAAGNSGPGEGTVSSPSTADAALSVGAVDANDQVADFSSRGPRTGDYAFKPEITAPGVNIVAAKAAHGQIGDPAPVDGYVTLSGTSMATPHVAGAAAILTGEHPGWSSRLRKNALMASADPTPGTGAFDQGAGRVDVAREITQTVTADEGSLSFGLQSWPHADDRPITKPITYRNDGTAPVDLTLTGPGGAFTVADTHLTVPAGGTASTTVTADTRGPEADGLLSGYLTATAANDIRVETPLGVDKEVESYDVTVDTTNRDGTPSADHFVSLFNLDTGRFFNLYAAAGSETVRLPKGRYGLYAWIFEAGHTATVLTEGELTVGAAMTLDADARKGGPVVLTPPQAGAGTLNAAVSAEWAVPGGSFAAGLATTDFSALYAGPMSAATFPGMVASIVGTFADPGADGTYRNSSWTTELAYANSGLMFHGLVKAPTIRELAAVVRHYHQETPGTQGESAETATFPGVSYGWQTFTAFDLPFTRTEYLSPGATWQGYFRQELPGGDVPALVSDLVGPGGRFRAGHTYGQDWNRPVFGPNLTPPADAYSWIVRSGDNLYVNPPMSGDGAGHPGFTYDGDLTATLYQGDTKIGTGFSYLLPAAPATYRLEVSQTRNHALSTATTASWTFTSSRASGTGPHRLPLSSIRFFPGAGTRLSPIRVTVDHQTSTSTSEAVRVDISYDDGKSWHPTHLTGHGDQWLATVHYPRGPQTVSLRAVTPTLTETVLHAYTVN